MGLQTDGVNQQAVIGIAGTCKGGKYLVKEAQR
jgi:hypothetical protein